MLHCSVTIHVHFALALHYKLNLNLTDAPKLILSSMEKERESLDSGQLKLLPMKELGQILKIWSCGKRKKWINWPQCLQENQELTKHEFAVIHSMGESSSSQSWPQTQISSQSNSYKVATRAGFHVIYAKKGTYMDGHKYSHKIDHWAGEKRDNASTPRNEALHWRINPYFSTSQMGIPTAYALLMVVFVVHNSSVRNRHGKIPCMYYNNEKCFINGLKSWCYFTVKASAFQVNDYEQTQGERKMTTCLFLRVRERTYRSVPMGT